MQGLLAWFTWEQLWLAGINLQAYSLYGIVTISASLF